MLEVASVPDLRWHGDHSAFLHQCTNMLRESGLRQPRCSDDVPVFGPELKRCATAVDVALPARIVSGPAKLLVPWINHHGLFTVNELRRIDPGRRELQFTEGPRLFSCFLDLGLHPAMLATALGGLQRSETPPGVVNLESPEPPAFAPKASWGAPAAIEGTGATTTGQPARRALDTNASESAPARTPSRQQVVLVPQAPWVLPSELAAPPASPVAPPLNSRSSSAATTSPLLQASTANGAASESPGGPLARTQARTSLGKSPTVSPTSP